MSMPTEDPERVGQAMQNLLCDFEPEATAMTTHHGAECVLLEAQVTRNREIRDLVERCRQLYGERFDAELDERLDDGGVLHLRFAKQAAYQGELLPATGGDTIQVRIKIQAHPATRENALAAWQQIET